jgi:6-pyruvoyltetrahydropterin/6-carboxytetrahydropterin synthase
LAQKVRVARIFQFDAAHRLPGHAGKCAGIHGHTYTLEVVAEGSLQEKAGHSSDGMVVDFFTLDHLVEDLILEKVDHKYLNEVFDFRPTAENLAIKFLELLKTQGSRQDIDIISVKLWESPTSYCEVGRF